MGELDIRGKVTEIDAKKTFHLIEDHKKGIIDDYPDIHDPRVPTKTTLLKLFFGLEVGCGKRGRCGAGGAAYVANYSANNLSSSGAEFMDVEEEEKMMVEEEETQDIEIWQKQSVIQSGSGSAVRRSSASSGSKKGANKRQARRRSEQALAVRENPYLKKSYPCEV